MIRKIIIISFFYFAKFLIGQSDIFLFDNINVQDGLSESTVNVIYEDRNGFMYF